MVKRYLTVFLITITVISSCFNSVVQAEEAPVENELELFPENGLAPNDEKEGSSSENSIDSKEHPNLPSESLLYPDNSTTATSNSSNKIKKENSIDTEIPVQRVAETFPELLMSGANNLTQDNSMAGYTELPVTEGKTTLYALDVTGKYENRFWEDCKSDYGTLKNVTIAVDGIAYSSTNGYVQVDAESGVHSIKMEAAGFISSATYYTSDLSSKMKIGLALYPDNISNTITYKMGKLKSMDPWLGLYLESGDWYTTSDSFIWNTIYDKNLLNKYVKLTLEYGVVTNVEQVQDYNPTPYNKKDRHGYTREEIVRMTSQEYNNALSGYFEGIKAASKKSLKKDKKDSGTAGQKLRDIDQTKTSPLLTMQVNNTHDQAFVNAAYEGLAQYLDCYIQKGVDLGKINLNDQEVVIGARLVNKIRNSIDAEDWRTTTSKGYVVEISETGIWGAKFGTLTVSKGMSTYTGMLLTDADATSEILNEYLRTASDITKDTLRQGLQSVISELVSVTGLGEFTKGKLREILSNKVVLLQRIGCGSDVLRYAMQLKDDYDLSKAILEAGNASVFQSSLKDAKKIYENLKNRDYSDSSVNDKTVSLAISRIETAGNRFGDALFDYIYDTDEFSRKWGNKFEKVVAKVLINCPVDFEIKNNYTGYVVGSFIDGTVNYNDSYVDIEINGDRKTINFLQDFNAEIEYIPTDDGDMDLIIENYDDGVATGRLCFYDVELNEGDNYTQNINTQNGGTAVNSFPLIDHANNTITADEYISSDDDAVVNIDCVVEGEGMVVGNGDYVRGDSVTLSAVPDKGSAFKGWYENGNIVSTEGTYKFVADNIPIKAVFEDKDVIHPDFLPDLRGEYEDIIGIHAFVNANNPELVDIELKTEGISDVSKFSKIKMEAYLDNELQIRTMLNPDDNNSDRTWLKGLELSGYDEVIFYDRADKQICSLYYFPGYKEYEDYDTSDDLVLSEDLYCRDLDARNIITNGYNLVVTGRFMSSSLNIDNGSNVKIVDDVRGAVQVGSGKLISYGEYSSSKGIKLRPDSYAYFKRNIDSFWGPIEINNGTLITKGVFKCGELSMDGKRSKLNTGGDLSWSWRPGSSRADITNGTIEIGGNMYLDDYSENCHFLCTGNNNIIFNSNAPKLDCRAIASLNVVKCNNSKSISINARQLSIEELDSDINVIGEETDDYTYIRELCNNELHISEFKGNKINVDGSIDLSGKMNPKASLKINGNLCISDVLDLNSGTAVITGHACINSGGVYVNHGHFTVKRSMQLNGGLLIMQFKDDVVDVFGEFKCGNSYLADQRIPNVLYNGITYANRAVNGETMAVNNGVLKLYGDIYVGGEDKMRNYDPYIFGGSHLTEICGNDTQALSVAAPIFNKTAFPNGKISMCDWTQGRCIYLGKLVSDVEIKCGDWAVLGDSDLNGHTVTFVTTEQYMDVMLRGFINVNKGELKIQGTLDMTYSSGNESGHLYINGGKVYVSDTLHMDSSSTLKMDNKADLLDIDGTLNAMNVPVVDPSIYPKRNPFDVTSGTIKVAKTAEIIMNTDEPQTLCAEYFVLDGDTVLWKGEYEQDVYGRLSVRGITIDTLKLKYDKKNYSLYPDPCWNKLITAADSSAAEDDKEKEHNNTDDKPNTIPDDKDEKASGSRNTAQSATDDTTLEPVDTKYKSTQNVKNILFSYYTKANPDKTVKKIKFKSSNKKVVKVNKKGQAKGGKRTGTATITMYVKTQEIIVKPNGKTKKKTSKWTSAGTLTVNNTGK